MTERGQGVVAGCVFVVAGALAFAVARTIPSRMPVGIDSGVLPEIYAAGLFVCGAFLAAVAAVGPGRAQETEAGSGQETRGRTLALVLTIALIVGYVACLRYLGFILTSALFLFLQISLLDDRRPTSLLRQAAFAVIATGLIWVLFDKGFGLILPSGIFG